MMKKKEENEEKESQTRNILKSHVALPSQSEIEQMVLAQKKKDLLAKYG